MEVCLMIEGQEDVSWEDWRAIAAACEGHGVGTLFRSDHYLSVADRCERGSLDAWATIAAPLTRLMAQHLLHRDLDAIELIGRSVNPALAR